MGGEGGAGEGGEAGRVGERGVVAFEARGGDGEGFGPEADGGGGERVVDGEEVGRWWGRGGGPVRDPDARAGGVEAGGHGEGVGCEGSGWALQVGGDGV